MEVDLVVQPLEEGPGIIIEQPPEAEVLICIIGLDINPGFLFILKQIFGGAMLPKLSLSTLGKLLEFGRQASRVPHVVRVQVIVPLILDHGLYLQAQALVAGGRARLEAGGLQEQVAALVVLGRHVHAVHWLVVGTGRLRCWSCWF